MMSYDMENHYGNFLKNEFPVLLQMFEDVLEVKYWGFHQTFAGVGAQIPPTAIYDSEWCRVRFMLLASDRHDNRIRMGIRYGRLHAPIESLVTTWNGEQCHCWHEINMPLYFLDGLTPQETIARQSRWPDQMEQFEQSISAQEKNLTQPEWLVQMHASIWRHYGRRLFELFDLRRPDLWEQFAHFLREYDKLYEGPPVPIYPPLYKIC